MFYLLHNVLFDQLFQPSCFRYCLLIIMGFTLFFIVNDVIIMLSPLKLFRSLFDQRLLLLMLGTFYIFYYFLKDVYTKCFRFPSFSCPIVQVFVIQLMNTILLKNRQLPLKFWLSRRWWLCWTLLFCRFILWLLIRRLLWLDRFFSKYFIWLIWCHVWSKCILI